MSNFPVLSKKSIELCENDYKNATGFDDRHLMELAGFACAKKILNFCGPLDDDHLVVFAGPGKNGGDGITLAYFLSPTTKKITIYMPVASKCNVINANIERIKKFCANVEFSSDIPDGDIYIDALFGTGFDQKLSKKFEEIITFINRQSKSVISIDVPSGLDADGDAIANIDAVKPNLTIAVGCLKPIHQCLKSDELCGDIVCVDIGLPFSMLIKYAENQKIAC